MDTLKSKLIKDTLFQNLSYDEFYNIKVKKFGISINTALKVFFLNQISMKPEKLFNIVYCEKIESLSD